jgi:phage tail sheath protein FI
VSDRCQICAISQDDIDNGRLMCVVGVAPVTTAEFVSFGIDVWDS